MTKSSAQLKLTKAQSRLDMLTRLKTSREEQAAATGRHQWEGPNYADSIATQDAEIKRAERQVRAYQAIVNKAAA